MKTYCVVGTGKRFAVVVSVIGFAVLFVWPMVNVPVWFVLLGLVLVWMAFSFFKGVYKIRIEPGGTLAFVRLLGTLRIPARDIYRLSGVREVDDYQRVTWKMYAYYRSEHITV